MIIYFRACEKQQTISNVNRYSNVSKTTLLKKCWLSIQASVSPSDKIIILHDSVSTNTLDWLITTCKTEQLKVCAVPSHPWDYHQHTVTLVEQLAKYCAVYPNELHYIVEDDYLHVDSAISFLNSELENWKYFAVPYDYVDRYWNPEPSNVILGRSRHWRTITSSTMTVIARGSTWANYINLLEESAPTSNDKVFEQIYKQTMCISPIPGVSSHMTEFHLTPYIDWSAEWNRYDA